MAIIPQISLSLGNQCDTVTLTESTKSYTVGTNPGGWGTPNDSASAITSASVKVYDSTATTLLQTFPLKSGTVNLYAGNVNYPTSDEFVILQDALWIQPDGIYKIVYDITTSTTVTTNTYELFLCNLCNCRDNLIVKLIDACSSETVKKLKDQVDQMEIFIYGIETSFACGDFDTAENILTAASTYCTTISGCLDCGCGGNC